MAGAAEVESVKALLAQGTRILYEHGVVDAFGHLSYRLPGTDHFLINPRQSPALLRPETVLTMTLDGELVAGDGRPNSEWHIHASIYRARPDVASVVHAHSDMSVLFSHSRAGWRPLVGHSSGIFGADPLPIYRSPGLITDRARGDRLAATLGDRAAVLLRGHGCAVVGRSVQETVLLLLDLERNGRLVQGLLAQGQGEPDYWSAEEIAVWNDSALHTAWSNRYWEYLTARPPR